MISATPVEVVADFFPALNAHDKLSALSRLRDVETLMMVGDKDLLTPASHSRRMAEALPGAELLILEGAGYLSMIESPEQVTLRLRAFLPRAACGAYGGSAS